MASTPQSLTGIDLAEAAELAAQLRADSVWSSGDELLAAAGVDAQHIEPAARDLLNAT
jgi:hypothetical protein